MFNFTVEIRKDSANKTLVLVLHVLKEHDYDFNSNLQYHNSAIAICASLAYRTMRQTEDPCGATMTPPRNSWVQIGRMIVKVWLVTALSVGQ